MEIKNKQLIRIGLIWYLLISLLIFIGFYFNLKDDKVIDLFWGSFIASIPLFLIVFSIHNYIISKKYYVQTRNNVSDEVFARSNKMRSLVVASIITVSLMTILQMGVIPTMLIFFAVYQVNYFLIDQNTQNKPKGKRNSDPIKEFIEDEEMNLVKDTEKKDSKNNLFYYKFYKVISNKKILVYLWTIAILTVFVLWFNLFNTVNFGFNKEYLLEKRINSYSEMISVGLCQEVGSEFLTNKTQWSKKYTYLGDGPFIKYCEDRKENWINHNIENIVFSDKNTANIRFTYIDRTDSKERERNYFETWIYEDGLWKLNFTEN